MRALGVFCICLMPMVLGACSTNSDGSVSAGVVGSPAWHLYAPPQDVTSYYDRLETFELCLRWDRAVEKKIGIVEVRGAIGKTLIRRGKQPTYCANPKRDLQIRQEKLNADILGRRQQTRRMNQPRNVYIDNSDNYTQSPLPRSSSGINTLPVKCISRKRFGGSVKVMCR
ncbi:MAG: hypothetical protein P1V21_12655 [Rhizobiaceae bacterium]|nr:hypothetical protein [Rhizobiaceae bacterium]